MFHPDDIVLVFTRNDVQDAMPEGCTLSLDDACEVISRNFDCSMVFDQMADILREADRDDD